MARSWEFAVLRALLIGGEAVLFIRWMRLSDRAPDWVIVGEDDPLPPVAERRYTCRDTPRGNVHGNCAESWWQHFWNNWPYCRDVKFWCELAGGKFEKH